MASVAEGLVHFLNRAWTQFHATAECVKMFEAAGFVRISEREEWKLENGGKYFLTRNGTTLIAFVIGGKFKAGNGFNIVAAHTDSPCPKLKPVSASIKSGFLKVGVQTYGGGLWHTWFDRDLSVAGRVLIQKPDGCFKHSLVKVDRPIMRIPTVAIHLDRNVMTDGFRPNFETHLAPVLATSIKSAIGDEPKSKETEKPRHHALLLDILAKELGVSPAEIADFDLNVCDTQPSVVGGANLEFIFSGRLDNLCMAYTSTKALIDAAAEEAVVQEEPRAWMVSLFDHEEVGSDSAQGAGSPVMFEAMRRATLAVGPALGEGLVERMNRDSFLVSADMAHAMHPNYPEKHEENHQPKLHKGLVIKHNTNQRYATTDVSSVLFREVARRAEVPVQDFCVRNDMGCGSTIGPILASGIGIRCIDVGVPQLSMHSVREMCGTDDVGLAHKHFVAFFKMFTAVDSILDDDF